MIRNFTRIFATLLLGISSIYSAKAWSEHPLLAYPVLSTIPDLTARDSVVVMSLRAFLEKEEAGLEKLLAEHEAWARANMPDYSPLPEELMFKKTENYEDILLRFYHAIRINPNVKMRLYLHLLPNQDVGGLPPINPAELTTLSDVTMMLTTNYVELFEGQKVSPLSVLCTANDEPDYGIDLGLFEDNNTEHGKIYGLGVQPFGDPNLEYGSQAPFHMGFYHEAKLVFKFGPFLKKTYPEYRINLFKTLSEYAFATGNDYWGYRFMGWGMHYLSDLSMPYHTAPLPGVSAFRMIWINLKAMLGFPRSKDNAVQIVSNRHSVLEQFQWLVVKEAYMNDPESNPIIAALKNPIEHVDYTDDFPRNIVAKESVDRSKRVDKNLKKYSPKQMVSDPKFETPGSKELDNLVELMKQERGEESVDKMTGVLAEIMRSYSMHMRSYYKAITGKMKG